MSLNTVSMRLIAAAAGPIVFLCLPLCAEEKLDKPVRIPSRTKTVVVDQVVPAYRAGNAVLALKPLSPILARLNEVFLPSLDALLQENNLPATQELVADARLQLLRLGQLRLIREPRGIELRLLLQELETRVEVVLDEAKNHPVMADELPKEEDVESYEQVFWSIHVLGNKLINARQIAAYGSKLSENGKKGRQLPEAPKDTPDFSEILADVEQTGTELSERRIELHLQRLELSESVLRESNELRQRIFAAYSLDFDGHLLQQFLKINEPADEGGRPELGRERLSAVGIDERVDELVESGRESAGDLQEKSRLFFEGLHWWMRGRYGRGTEQNGLMKSRFAMKSPQAQMALLMPATPPKPMDPLGGQDYQTPEVDRRHYYTWTTEQQRFQTTTVYFH